LLDNPDRCSLVRVLTLDQTQTLFIRLKGTQRKTKHVCGLGMVIEMDLNWIQEFEREIIEEREITTQEQEEITN